MTGFGAPTLRWIVVGGESGGGARPFDIDWLKKVIVRCEAAKVPCFAKQLGKKPYDGFVTIPRKSGDSKKYLKLKDKKGGNWDEWAENLRVRQYPERTTA